YEDVDFSIYEELPGMLPDGMKALAATGGILEYPTWIMGYETLCYKLVDDPELVKAVVDRCSEHLVTIYETYVQIDVIGACWVSDDMGFKTQTMISPDDLRKYIFPWQKRLAEVIHKSGRPALLHSCGNLSAVMDDLIDDVGIDAKHSFEDVIEPVTVAKTRWGDRISLLGGIDVDFLCRSSHEDIRAYVRRTLRACAPGGGYALGTGNSVANYVPVANFLTMMEEGWKSGTYPIRC
ncbi:MAG: uroporphyrinogen-III decarboxylase-like protein, partial [Planctomycetes bacterium]|nr:uroporphyrinogen-III decarboxylase-like protein [Planctomycetota bacterium]